MPILTQLSIDLLHLVSIKSDPAVFTPDKLAAEHTPLLACSSMLTAAILDSWKSLKHNMPSVA